MNFEMFINFLLAHWVYHLMIFISDSINQYLYLRKHKNDKLPTAVMPQSGPLPGQHRCIYCKALVYGPDEDCYMAPDGGDSRHYPDALQPVERKLGQSGTFHDHTSDD